MNNTSGNNLTDKHLVEKVLSGDARAFAHIIKNTEGLVTQIVFKMISNPADRKDLAQDIYLKAFKNLSRFQFQSKLSTWIARISYNTCLDYLRKKKLLLTGDIYEETRTGDEPMDLALHRSVINHGNEGATPMPDKELSLILKTEIDKLPPVFKLLITLFHTEELTYDEIMQITELPEGTVKNYLFRARKTLKNNLLLNYKKEDLC